MLVWIRNRTHPDGLGEVTSVALFDFIGCSRYRLRRSAIPEKIPRVCNNIWMDNVCQSRSMCAPLTSFTEQRESCNSVGQLPDTWVRLTAERSKAHRYDDRTA